MSRNHLYRTAKQCCCHHRHNTFRGQYPRRRPRRFSPRSRIMYCVPGIRASPEFACMTSPEFIRNYVLRPRNSRPELPELPELRSYIYFLFTIVDRIALVMRIVIENLQYMLIIENKCQSSLLIATRFYYAVAGQLHKFRLS